MITALQDPKHVDALDAAEYVLHRQLSLVCASEVFFKIKLNVFWDTLILKLFFLDVENK